MVRNALDYLFERPHRQTQNQRRKRHDFNLTYFGPTTYAGIRYANADLTNETVFDRENDRYLIVSYGWQGVRQLHGTLIHVDINAGKVWVHRDGTEYGIANELVDAGIPKDRIVLGFHSPQVRPHTGFAVA